MSVLVFIETENSLLKKNFSQIASYGVTLSKKLGVKCIGIAFNAEDCEKLAEYGITEVTVFNSGHKFFDCLSYANVICNFLIKNHCKILVISSSADSKYIGPFIANKWNGHYAPNIVEIPSTDKNFVVKQSCYTNKAFSYTEIYKDKIVIGVSNNSFIPVKEKLACKVKFENLKDRIKTIEVLSVDKFTGRKTIADSDIVVSGGRGLKGPENWYLIEDLADVLGAATACSKPISDMGWRTHDEHVGQTGKPVSSKLYIAIGISGAIQHVAGIAKSKVKVVINNDPEAPFFKSADFGIVGDAFEVVPDLIQKLKKFKSSS